MNRRVVLAIDDQGATRAIGPVGLDESIEKLRDEVEALGWENYGVVSIQSAQQFREEIARRRQ